MEITGSNFLLVLAQLSVSFVGFSTIVVTLRQVTGSSLSEYHLLLFRFFIEAGLAVTGLALIPSLLAMFISSEGDIWRIASGLAAISIGGYMISYVLRRRKAEHQRLPYRLYVYYAITAVSIVALFVVPGPGVYTLSVTWTLVAAALVFLHGLPLFFQGRLEE